MTAREKVLGRHSTETTRNGKTWNLLPYGTMTRTRFGMDTNDDGRMPVQTRRQMRCGQAETVRGESTYTRRIQRPNAFNIGG